MDIRRVVDGFMSSGVGGGLTGGVAGGLLVNALTGKKGKKVAGQALKLGGAAVVGGLAWKAYERYRNGGSQGHVTSAPETAARTTTRGIPDIWQQATEDKFLNTETPAEPKPHYLIILRSMIAAAHADGHVDSPERRKIFDQVDQWELTPAERGVLLDELRAPVSVVELAREASDPGLASEAYAAALLVLDPASPVAVPYLRELAAALRIPSELVSELHKTVGFAEQSSHSRGRFEEVA